MGDAFNNDLRRYPNGIDDVEVNSPLKILPPARFYKAGIASGIGSSKIFRPCSVG